MAKLLVLTLCVTAALAADIDWTKLRPGNINIDKPVRYEYLPLLESTRKLQQGRITGGNEAPKNAFPHQVALFLGLEEYYSFCGGSLISNQWIVTAAHCCDGALNATVYLGAHNVRDPDEDNLKVEVDATNFIIHESWDSSRIRNDIALIRLPKPIEFTDKIKPIALPRAADIDVSFEGEPAVASGWGKDSDEATSISPVLRYIETEILQLLICKLLFFFTPSDNNICITGSNGASTCNGDSGGPLMAFEANGTPILVGITSFGSGSGCEVGYPAVFTRTTSYLDWISQHTGIPLR